MTSKKSFSDFRRENEQDYHKRFVEPFDEGLRILEEKKKLAEENPEAALKDPFILAVSGFREKLEKSKVRLEQSARNLLLAHAGGAVLTINMLPSIMENKVLLKIAADALDNFTLGLLFLLVSYILITFRSLTRLVQDLLKAIHFIEMIIERDYK